MALSAKKRAESTVDSELASRILRNVSIIEAFLFFTGVGQYDGEFASSLSDFCEKLKTTPLNSIEFHLKRGDFERWIKETLGDEYLANRIGKIDRSIRGEGLRKTLQAIVKRRLDQLKATTMNRT